VFKVREHYSQPTQAAKQRRNKMKFLITITMLVLAGCANEPSPGFIAFQQKIPELQQKFVNTIPICNDAGDCAAKWGAAQLWVIHNAGYKIQTTTTNLIETYGPLDGASGWKRIAVRVTKEPIGGDKYRITPLIVCGSFAERDCIQKLWAARQSFNDTVGLQSNTNMPSFSSTGTAVFGVSVIDLPPTVASSIHHENMKAAFVIAVIPDSISDKAGFKVGDVIYEFDGKPIEQFTDLQKAASETDVGRKVLVKLLRGEMDVSIDVQF
jgi:PDZ domain